MKIVSRLLGHFGYVRLKDYGYELTPAGKIVQVTQVEDDRFAPPPWQPVAFQTASSLLPPRQPAAPRPLPPPPAGDTEEAEPQPLFKVPGAPATVETAAPGKPATLAAAEEDDDPISIDEAPEEEEWEWKMALARARENAEKDKKEREKAKQERMAARRGDGSTFKTSSLPLAPPTPPAAKVVDAAKPMSRIARPEPRIARAEPRGLTAQPARKAPDSRAATTPDRPRFPSDRGRSPITRLEPRSVTAQPTPQRTAARTAPPKAPPGSKSRPLAVTAPPPATTAPPPAARPEPARPIDSKPAARASLEKSVARVLPSPPAGKPRPLARLARGTEGPTPPGGGAQPTRPQLALGSSRLPAVRDPSNDVTATDITAVDRARASMKEEEDTRVNVAVLPPSADITLDIALDPEEKTSVDAKPNGVPIVSVAEGSPLPRLTARLRRQSVPN